MKTIKSLVLEHLSRDSTRNCIYHEIERMFGVSHLQPTDALQVFHPELVEEKLRLDRELAHEVEMSLAKFVRILRSLDEGPTVAIFCGYWYDDIDEYQYEVLLFCIEDILSLPIIPAWDRIDVSCNGTAVVPYTIDFYTLDDNQIQTLLKYTHLIPAPIDWGKESLPMVLGSGYSPNSVEHLMVSNILADCMLGKGGQLPNYKMFKDGVIPFELREDTYSERNLGPWEADQRRAVLRSFIRLYKSMMKAKSMLLSENQITKRTNIKTFHKMFLDHIREHGYEVLDRLRADILDGVDEGYIDEMEQHITFLLGALLTVKIESHPERLFVLYEEVGANESVNHIALWYDTDRVWEIKNIPPWDRISLAPDELDDIGVIVNLASIGNVPWSYNMCSESVETAFGSLCAPCSAEHEYEFIVDVIRITAENLVEENPINRDPISDFDDETIPLPQSGEDTEDEEYNAELRRRVLYNYLSLYKALIAARDALYKEGWDSIMSYVAPGRDDNND